MFPAVLFITSGDWVKVSILLYFITLSYDMIEFLVELVSVLSIAIISTLWEPSIGNCS